MESFLNRYRNITVLFLVIFGQLLFLAFQVKSDRNVPVIRVWTVTAITPFARVLEAIRGGGSGFFHNYIFLHNADAENRRLREEVGRLKLDNIFLRNQLSTADRARALALFQQQTQSKTLAAVVIMSGAGVNSKVVFVDRGSTSGVERGMAVVTPDGIVGKVVDVSPTASQVLLATDSDFAAGVISQKGGVRGTFKGQGSPIGKVDYVSHSEKVEVGEWFYTSGDDRIFPRGFPVGVVKSVNPGKLFQEVLVEPSGLEHLDEVLIVIEGVHREIPPVQTANSPIYIAPAPPDAAEVREAAAAQAGATPTEADKLRATYKAAGEAQGHKYGEGYKAPDLLKLPGATPLPAGNAAAAGTPQASPAPGASGATPAGAPAPANPPAQKTPPNERLANQAAGAGVQPGTSGH